MKAKRLFMVFVLFVIFPRGNSKYVESAQKKTVGGEDGRTAFAKDINDCLFQYWTRYVGTKEDKQMAVLQERVGCRGTQLCYGANHNGMMAQFAVGYNQQTLIPEFTGHVVNPNTKGEGEGRDRFTHDLSIDPVATDQDYAHTQFGLYVNYNSVKNREFNRGHLTPNADFRTDEDRTRTMVTTNIAPQWKQFNSGNWESLEVAIRAYINRKGYYYPVYVFTGTGGKAANLQGVNIKLNEKVQVPKYFWKAVCDPVKQESVFVWAENTFGNNIGHEDQMTKCCGKWQRNKEGIICCSSLDEARRDYHHLFQIPQFHAKNCVPSKEGNGLKEFIVDRLKTVDKEKIPCGQSGGARKN